MLTLRNIEKIYNNGSNSCVHALNKISLTIEDGEMVAIVGSSGSGKSTLLNIMGCLDKPTMGEYIIDGKSAGSFTLSQIAEMRNKMFGFVLQDFAVIDNWRVFQNVELPLAYAKRKCPDKNERVNRILEELGILDKKNTYVSNLSGGQKQRVAIARALINDPKVILADEPTGALDTKTGLDVLNILRRINSKGKTVVIVTHNLEIAQLCDRVIRVEDGRII